MRKYENDVNPTRADPGIRRPGSGNVRRPWHRHLAAIMLILLLTALTQIGGLVWLVSRLVIRQFCHGAAPAVSVRAARLSRHQLLMTWGLAVPLYGVLTAVIIPPIAAWPGRVRLACFDNGGVLMPAGPLACTLNRNYLRPELRTLLTDLAEAIAQQFPGSRVTTLEAGFPFIDGFPMLPHLSHRNGRKVDIAFFYRDSGTDQPIAGGSPSPLGYFLYEQPRPDEIARCRDRWAPLRWDFAWLQPSRPTWTLDQPRTAAILAWLQADPRVLKIFIEPYLAQCLNVTGGKIRFQGCHAARHDDHIHIEIE